MSVQNRATIKGYFNTGDVPTEPQFADLVDSFWHKSDDTLTVDWANVASKPTTFVPSAHTHAWADITSKPTLFSGAYADLTGKPTLFSGAYADLTGTPTLFSGAWVDLTGKPTTFAPSAHVHSASDITSGALAAARLAAGTPTDTYVIKIVSGTPTWAAAAGGGGTPAGSTGQVQYNNAGAFGASANFFWDATNSRLGIGTASPSYAFDVNGAARIQTVPTIITATKMLVKDPTTGQVSEQLIPAGGSGWGLTLNAGTNPVTNGIGTSDNTPVVFKINSGERGRIGVGGDFAFGGGNSVSGSGFGLGYGAMGAGASIGQNSSTVSQSFAFGENATCTQSFGTALGINAKSQHAGAVVISTRIQGATFLTSDADYQFKVAASKHTFQIGATPATAFEILASGKLAAYSLATYASEAAGLAAEASGVIFKVGNILYHKP